MKIPILIASFLLIVSRPTLMVFHVTPIRARTYDVCSLLRAGIAQNGHNVTVVGELIATTESVRLDSTGCERSVFLIYQPGKWSSKSPQFEEAVTSQIALVDTRPVEVTVKGIFRRQVPIGRVYVSQLIVTKILDVHHLCPKGNHNR